MVRNWIDKRRDADERDAKVNVVLEFGLRVFW